MIGKHGLDLYEKAKKLIPGGTQLLSKRPEMYLPDQWPGYYARANGAEVWDLDGNHYYDMSNNGVGSCPLGYADPDVNAAVKQAIDSGSMCTLNCPEEVELAELLCELHPWASMVRYARTGGEIMSVAVRIARAKTGRSRVAFCGYHGWSDWYLAANLAESDALGDKGLLLSGLEPAGVPVELSGTAYGFRHNKICELHDLVTRHNGDFAAIICEVHRGEKPDPAWLGEVREIATRIGAVLIFDEITSAMRLNPGGVHLLYGVNPDLAVFAKGISNGFPMAAVIGVPKVMEASQKTFISSTYWTERVGPTAALATIKKHRHVKAEARLIEAGRHVQKIWSSAAIAAGLHVHIGHADMSPLSHIAYDYPNARAIQTLHCQMMLDHGFLDNTGFYATYVHTADVLARYESAVNGVFPELAEAINRGKVECLLRGPVGHSGFARLTS